MKIIIHAKNIELTPAIKSYVDEKVGSLSKFLPVHDDVIETRVEVGKPSLHHREGPVFYAEVNLLVGGKLIRANEKNFDLYAAIDKVRDEVEAQIKKFKEKRTDLSRQPKEK
jgi:putative sigma-54 modulation protein